MAQVFCTGPALLYVDGEFLGTSEFSPYIDIKPAYKPVFNDLGGRLVPFDKTYQCQEAFVFYNLTRWNEDVYQNAADRPSQAGLGSNPGTDIGSLMIQEGLASELEVVFPYHSDPSFSDMPAGYHFLAAWMEGPDHLEPLGTEARALRVFFYCAPKFTLGGPGGYSMKCYDLKISASSSVPN